MKASTSSKEGNQKTLSSAHTKSEIKKEYTPDQSAAASELFEQRLKDKANNYEYDKATTVDQPLSHDELLLDTQSSDDIAKSKVITPQTESNTNDTTASQRFEQRLKDKANNDGSENETLEQPPNLPDKVSEKISAAASNTTASQRFEQRLRNKANNNGDRIASGVIAQEEEVSNMNTSASQRFEQHLRNKASDVSGDTDRKVKQIGKVEIINDEEGPIFPAAVLNDDKYTSIGTAKLTAAEVSNPVQTVIDTGDCANRVSGDAVELHTAQSGNTQVTRSDIEAGGFGMSMKSAIEEEEEVGAQGTTHMRASVNGITEAYAVHGSLIIGEIIIDEPNHPWYKQRRLKVLCGLVIVIVGALAIALGLVLERDNTQAAAVGILSSSDSPSISSSPTISAAPSSSPTACVDTITGDAQIINLQQDIVQLSSSPEELVQKIDNLNNLTVAIDGNNMAVLHEMVTGPVFIAFYSLDTNNDEWRIVQAPIKVENKTCACGGRVFDVAISQTTTFIGSHCTCITMGGYDTTDTEGVIVYGQNLFGQWKEVEDPFTHNSTYVDDVHHLSISGDLACVGGSCTSPTLYRREDRIRWTQVDTLPYGGCSVSGDTIVIDSYDEESQSYFLQIYEYNQGRNEVDLIQDPIPITGRIGSMAVNSNSFVYWLRDDSEAFFYHRNKASQTFTLHQQLSMSTLFDIADISDSLDDDDLYGFHGQNGKLALDNDVLVVGSNNSTHIFSLTNDEWGKIISLDSSYYDFQISGRTIASAKLNVNQSDDVFIFNIQDCTQDMPTQSL